MPAKFEGEPNDVLLGGVLPVGDKFQAVFQLHRPCVGGDHKPCTVVQTFESTLFDTMEQAIAQVTATQQELEGQGITDWQAEAVAKA